MLHINHSSKWETKNGAVRPPLIEVIFYWLYIDWHRHRTASYNFCIWIYLCTYKGILNLATNTETIQSLLAIRKPLMYLIEFIRQHIIESRVSLFASLFFRHYVFFLRFQMIKINYDDVLILNYFIKWMFMTFFILFSFQCPLEWFHYVSVYDI